MDKFEYSSRDYTNVERSANDRHIIAANSEGASGTTVDEDGQLIPRNLSLFPIILMRRQFVIAVDRRRS